MADYPSFDEAVGRFQAFVRSQDLTDQLVHVTDDDLVVLGRQWFVRRIDPTVARTRAREIYDQAVRQGRGVSLTGRCILSEALCVHVYGPIDDDEAERLTYPDGLKLSVAVEHTNRDRREPDALGRPSWPAAAQSETAGLAIELLK